LKILFAIQGTGNGHISRARDVYPELCRHGDVDVLVSGIQLGVELPFPVKHRLYGMSFIMGDQGGVDMWATFRRLRLPNFLRDAKRLNVRQYDLVVNDFEPISAWAAKLQGVPCISLSHQWAVADTHAPRPELGDWKGEAVLKRYAPCTDGYGFHFKTYSKKIFTPVIRREVRDLIISDEGHVTVYLPAYHDSMLISFFQRFEDQRWEVFSRHCTKSFVRGNVCVKPIENTGFLKSMASSTAVMCGAGFETPAEALFLGKKLMVIPMEGQYEQQCNAAALASLSVPAIKKISLKYYDSICFWLSGPMKQVAVNYPDQTGKIVDTLIADFNQNYRKAHQPAIESLVPADNH
jgi:uncharacterized protein (TIGR00661 family)